MYHLLTFPPSFGQPSHSPFCVKAMCLLNMAGVGWQPEFVSNPSKMPLGKLPVLRDGEALIPDSAHIQAHLEARGVDFTLCLSDAQKGSAHAMMRMIEDSLYLHVVNDRWLDERNWPIVRDVFFAEIPKLIRKPITNGIRKTVRKGLTGQGFARFSEADRMGRLRRDLTAISAQLGTQKFLFGDQPCATDASLAPAIGMLLTLPNETAAQRIVKDWPGLAEYEQRCREAMYPKTAEFNAAA